jgi:hypothetical protein
LKHVVIIASLVTLILPGCAAPPGQKSSAEIEICDVITPPIGSRVPQTVRCEPAKGPVKATS